jgi:cellulose synthase/poly-beta-1,6-N-acetylglucosamine synthase-like glycosyltransferase
MKYGLEQAFAENSPRLSPRPAFWPAYFIWGGALALFAALFAQAFVQTGIGAWAVGLVYIAYDTLLLFFVAWKTSGSDDPDVAARPDIPPRPLTLTAIIAAHNEAAVLEATIESLRHQPRGPDAIIIADDGSSDATETVLKNVYGLEAPPIGSLSSHSMIAPELRWLRLQHGGKARALNAALLHVQTGILVTIDADTLLDYGALEGMRDAFIREPELVAATGVLRPICGRGWCGRLFQWFQSYEYVRNFLSRKAWMQNDGLLLISGAFAAFRRDPLITVGGFDPQCLVEDYEVIHRLRRHAVEHGHGWTVRVIGQATARTDAPGALVPFLRQRRRWFAGFLQTQYWNRDMIGNPRFGRLGTAMLPVKALDTVQPVYGIAAFVLLIAFVATGRLVIAMPIVIAMAAKVVIDLAWLIVSLGRYRRWTGHRLSVSGALLVAVIEPFSFQLLRHAGATWGWISLLIRRHSWGHADRGGIRDRSFPSAVI